MAEKCNIWAHILSQISFYYLLNYIISFLYCNLTRENEEMHRITI